MKPRPSFRFERTFALSEARYVAVWSDLALRSPRVLAVLALFLALSVACFFWPYTIALGILLLLLWGWLLFILGVGGLAMGLRYRRSRFLSETTTYGASEEAFWLRSPTVECKVEWRRLGAWRETAGLLVLTCGGLPPVYLPIEGLRREGVYEAVLGLARRHGKSARVFILPAPPDGKRRRRRDRRRSEIAEFDEGGDGQPTSAEQGPTVDRDSR